MVTVTQAELHQMIRAAVVEGVRLGLVEPVLAQFTRQLDLVRGKVPDTLPIEDDDVRRARIRKAVRALYPGTRGF